MDFFLLSQDYLLKLLVSIFHLNLVDCGHFSLRQILEEIWIALKFLSHL